MTPPTLAAMPPVAVSPPELLASDARTAPVRARAPRIGAATWIAAAVVLCWIPVQLLVTWPAQPGAAFDGPWRGDASMFVYEGVLVRGGQMPYLDFWDHKGPLIYLINAAGLAIAGGALWGVWLVGALAVCLAATAAFRALQMSFGDVASLTGVAFFVLALGGIDAAANMTELYALPLSFGAVLTLVRWSRDRLSAFRAGCCFGVLGVLAFGLRANLIGASVSGVVVISVLLLRDDVRHALLRFTAGAAAGAVVTATPVIAWLANGGALRAFWEQAIGYNLLYAQVDWTQRGVAALSGMWLATATAPLLLPVAGLVVCVTTLRARRARRARGRANAPALFAVVWAVVELALASLSGRPYDHYFLMLLPPMAMLSAAAVAWLVPRLSFGHKPRGRVALLASCALALVVIRPLVDRTVLRAQHLDRVSGADASQSVVAARFVREQSAPHERLLVWGLAGGMQYLANRPAASRYLFPYPLLSRGYGEAATADFLAELRRTPPELIVDATAADAGIPSHASWDPAWTFPRSRWIAPYRAMTPALHAFYELVRREYTPIAVIGPERWVVYRANSATADSATDNSRTANAATAAP